MTEPARKKIRANNYQTDHLIHFMARNRHFANGVFASANGLQRQNAQWQTLAEELAEIGPAKTVEQWKTSWRDLKSRAKANNAKANRAISSTGNLMEVPALSTQDKLILGTIGKVTSQGLPGVPESPIGEAASSMNPETLPSEYVSIVDDAQRYEEPLPSSQPRAGPSGLGHPHPTAGGALSPEEPLHPPFVTPSQPRAGPSGLGHPHPTAGGALSPEEPLHPPFVTPSQPRAGPSGLGRPHPTAGGALSSEAPLHPHFGTPRQPRAGPNGLGRPRLRPGTMADIYSAHSEEQTTILKEIASHLKERNIIEKERNKLLQEKNQILAL